MSGTGPASPASHRYGTSADREASKGGREEIKQPELFTGDEKPGNYRYSCCIANLTLPARVAYDACRGRAGPENRLKELKHDFSTDRFTLHDFRATEACGNFIVTAHNFMCLFRHALTNSTHRPFPKTIRYKLFAVAGYITQTADRKTLHLAKGLRNRETFPGIRRSLNDSLLPYVYP